MLKTKKNKGISLIALIVTIVVLLILVGVVINAVAGSENAKEKAAVAREKNEQGAELDAIKLAVVNSVASDLTGLVNVDDLKEGLNGIVEDEGRLRISADNYPWLITGKTGIQYKITNLGVVSVLFKMDNAIIDSISVDVGSTVPLTIINESEIEEIERCQIAKITLEGCEETEVASVAKNSTTGVWEVTGIAIPTILVDAESVNTILTIIGKSGVTKEVQVTVTKKVTLQVGDNIVLGDALAGVGNETGDEANKDDWIIVYDGTESTNQYTKDKIFVMLATYLPNKTREDLGIHAELNKNGDYKVYWSNNDRSSNAFELISKLKSDWEKLIYSYIMSKETISGKKVEVVGAIDLNTLNAIKGDGNYYLPQGTGIKANGYWLATSFKRNAGDYKIYYNIGSQVLSDYGYQQKNIGICPVAILPADIPLKKINGVWKIDTTQMIDSK